MGGFTGCPSTPFLNKMIHTTAKVSGGQKLDKFLRQAGKGSVKGVSVGFFDTARYPDGTPVATVAMWNEFGTRSADGSVHTPERPFFRNALQKSKRKISRLIADEVDPKKMIVSRETAERVGALVQGEIQKEIVSLRSPPNAPSTIRQKKSSNPLIGGAPTSGTMRLAVTWNVD